MTPDVSVIAAFLAGVLSISSPCVLPLIPLFLSHIAGVSLASSGQIDRRRLMMNALAYVAGFSAVFIALGVAMGAAGALVSTASVVASNRFWLVRIGGVVLMILGLQQLGLISIPGLNRAHRLDFARGSTGTTSSSFLIGATFGAGWSPCAGPILGAILTMAAGQGSPTKAAWLLTVYSAGLAIPFLAVAFFGSSTRALQRISRNMATVTSVSGGVMLAVGIIMVLGIYQQIFTRLAAMVPWTPWEPTI
jgi:cytochrome c-type biogenesis protein